MSSAEAGRLLQFCGQRGYNAHAGSLMRCCETAWPWRYKAPIFSELTACMLATLDRLEACASPLSLWCSSRLPLQQLMAASGCYKT